MTTAQWQGLDERELFALVNSLDTRGPRYTSYPTVPVWSNWTDSTLYESALSRTASLLAPVAVYLHFPFCDKRCLYCGCNSYITHDTERIHAYSNALLQEVRATAERAGGTLRHAHLHLGGGTPTHTPVAELERVLDAVLKWIPGTPDAERSVEVDPRVTSDAHLQVLAARGFRRISIGLQDVDPHVQQAVRREFPFSDMRTFVERARAFGFNSVNIDLIYGLPLQTRASWQTTLAAVVELTPDRLACFGYAHLPQKIKHQRAIHPEDLPAPHERLGMLLDANRFFTRSGYDAIGMDHFARPSDDLAVARHAGRLWRNFMGYTTVRGLELLGFGCSAISEFDSLFAQNVTPPEEYAARVQSGSVLQERGHRLDAHDRLSKEIVNHLMCNLEVRLPAELFRNHAELADDFAERMSSLADFISAGLVERTASGFRITALGQLFVRNIAMRFDRYLPQQSGVTYSRTV
jgi:oxygen-independent coproporphyrinogen-3 oxidase